MDSVQRATIELWMHVGGFLRKKEAQESHEAIALSNFSFFRASALNFKEFRADVKIDTS